MCDWVENKASHAVTLAWETSNVFNKAQLKTIMQSKYQAWNGNAPGTLVRHSLNCRKRQVNLAHTILHRSKGEEFYFMTLYAGEKKADRKRVDRARSK